MSIAVSTGPSMRKMTMKNIQPRGDLPMVQMPHITNAMPSRLSHAAQGAGPARNMTGIYLGSDPLVKGKDIQKTRTKKTVPPLARGRCVPSRARTPTELRRYLCSSLREDDACYPILVLRLEEGAVSPQPIPYLPSMPPSRYPLVPPQKMVELLRFKDDRKGFAGTGTPIQRQKKSPPATMTHTEMPLNSPRHEDDIAIWDMIRPTPRNYTPATNSGMTHLEYLNPSPATTSRGTNDDPFGPPTQEIVANELHRLAMNKKDLVGLMECYKKVCKGDINMLQSLLPAKDHTEASNPRYTGFSVKSYRNPQAAELMAEFPRLDSRSPATSSPANRPLVPSPYFFKSYNTGRATTERSGGSGSYYYPMEDYADIGATDHPAWPVFHHSTPLCF